MSNLYAPSTITADQLSRGRAYWRKQERRGMRVFSRMVSDTDKQAVLEWVASVRLIAAHCRTYFPCSRECV
jgi:hypothetical protein